MTISIAVLTIQCLIPHCTSLKQKRSAIRPLLSRLHREFNISAAEVDQLDSHTSAVIACACLSNNPDHSRQLLQKALDFIAQNFRDFELIEENIEFF